MSSILDITTQLQFLMIQRHIIPVSSYRVWDQAHDPVQTSRGRWESLGISARGLLPSPIRLPHPATYPAHIMIHGV